MKKLYAIVLISVLTTAGRADDLATSFKQAAVLGDAQEKEPAHGHISLNWGHTTSKNTRPSFCLV
jgi:hypothetical protein